MVRGGGRAALGGTTLTIPKTERGDVGVILVSAHLGPRQMVDRPPDRRRPAWTMAKIDIDEIPRRNYWSRSAFFFPRTLAATMATMAQNGRPRTPPGVCRTLTPTLQFFRNVGPQRSGDLPRDRLFILSRLVTVLGPPRAPGSRERPKQLPSWLFHDAKILREPPDPRARRSRSPPRPAWRGSLFPPTHRPPNAKTSWCS